MPDSQQCLAARASLKEIRSLRIDFGSAYAGAASYGNPEGAERAAVLKGEIETRLASLRETVAIHEAERMFDLRRQYDAQTSLLWRAGLVDAVTETDEFGVEREMMFMTGIDGIRYPLPSYETVALRFAERKELLAAKADQGFTKLVLVPFGMSIDQIFIRFQSHLLEYKRSYDEAHRNDAPPSTFLLKLDQPASWSHSYTDADVLTNFVYDPVSFGLDHGGTTKKDILAGQAAEGDTAAGWRVLLVQAGDGGKGVRGIPKRGTGTFVGVENPRRDVDIDGSAAKFLAKQQDASAREDSPYFGESGMCPEDWLVLFLTHLEETGEPLDNDWTLGGSTVGAILTGAYSARDGQTLRAFWSPTNHAVELGVSWANNADIGKFYGPRLAVRA